MSTPLLDRIARQGRIEQPEQASAESEGTGLQEGKPAAPAPVWLRRLTDKDMTATIYSDGCGPTGRAA